MKMPNNICETGVYKEKQNQCFCKIICCLLIVTPTTKNIRIYIIITRKTCL